jgi:RNA polymerase sigma-70 factor (ECF subfamily)
MSSGGYTALKSGAADTISFDFVFNNYYSYVSRLARTLLRNAQDAEDVTQEVFLRVHKSLSSYDPTRGTLNSWLGKFTINACRTHQHRSFFHRLWGSARPDEDDEDVQALVDSSPFADPEDHVLQAEMRKTVKDVLAKLRPKHRTVLVLHHYMDLSCAEIALMLDCPEGTVHSRLHYARRVVQTQLELQLRRANGEA